MAHRTMVGGTAYEVGGGKALVDGTAYSIKNGKTLVDGTGYEIGFAKTLGGLAVGSTVFMNVDGSSREFLVVHQGLPDATLYDSSCNGTWLLLKRIISTSHKWDDDSNSYADSFIHSQINLGTFFGRLDSDIQSIVKTVKIPYMKGTGNNGSVANGASGLSTKAFLLSHNEVGGGGNDTYYASSEGAALDYFKGAGNSARIAYRVSDYTAVEWWLRTPQTNNNYQVWTVWTNGQPGCYIPVTYTLGVRPAIILPPETLVDENFNVIA